ncbi:lipase family protein [Hymenobacter terricola]|uniref:lipase family protein n=1 Tax=Hymenobacter terricola TaxID=2819236 RepID=UPI001B3177A0|nr:lipase family protein [Hymenobacter terricola]
MHRFSLLLVLLLNLAGQADLQAQILKPGFDKAEYLELIRLHARMGGDSMWWAGIPKPRQFTLAYRSPVSPLDNRWDLWTHGGPRPQAAISVRGTTDEQVSWLANFYAAMLPAAGELQLAAGRKFAYHLADDPQAAVHAGWLLSLAFMADGIVHKVDSCYRRGTRDVFIMGHSQGGAIAFLLTSYLRDLQQHGQLPADIRFKTYCSAGPKPGNRFYAYAFETATQGGWATNVVNPADWVPEVPLSVQTLDDFSPVNPFVGARAMIKKQKFPKNLALRHVYNQLDRPARRAQRRYQRYLGGFIAKAIAQHIPDYQGPAFYPSSNYVRAGTTVVLPADAAYYLLYPNDPNKLFRHHFFQPYYYLAERLP